MTDFVRRFGHLPYVMGEGNRKLSKRDPQAALNTYRAQGYLPEGLLNYLALLGWSIADDHAADRRSGSNFDFGIYAEAPHSAAFGPYSSSS